MLKICPEPHRQDMKTYFYFVAFVILIIGIYASTNGSSNNNISSNSDDMVINETLETLDEPIRETVVDTEQAQETDNRGEALDALFAVYDSRWEDLGKEFVEVADNYDLDWRLLPAIAGTESSFGKNTPSCAPRNPFGWTSTTSPCGYYRFNSWEDAIETVAQKIAHGKAYTRYQQTGEIHELAHAYNPLNTQKWERDINFFIGAIERKVH